MTIKELVQLLKSYPEETKVVVPYGFGEYGSTELECVELNWDGDILLKARHDN